MKMPLYIVHRNWLQKLPTAQLYWVTEFSMSHMIHSTINKDVFINKEILICSQLFNLHIANMYVNQSLGFLNLKYALYCKRVKLQCGRPYLHH